MTEYEKLEVLENEKLENELLKIETINKKVKKRNSIKHKKYLQLEMGNPIIRENYNTNIQYNMED